MTRGKAGLALFWAGVVWMFAWVIVAIARGPLMHSLTLDELNQTIWALTGPMNALYGLSIPLGAVGAGIGMLLYAGAKGSTAWKVGIGSLIALVASLAAMALNYYSAPVFGVGGTLILLSFIGIVWLSAKERIALEGSSTTGADFKLAGYVFMVMAAWFI